VEEKSEGGPGPVIDTRGRREKFLRPRSLRQAEQTKLQLQLHTTMTIRTIKTRVISMTREEHTAFMRALEQAKEGRTVHQGAVEMSDGSQLCVNVETEEEQYQREQAEARRREEQRYGRKH